LFCSAARADAATQPLTATQDGGNIVVTDNRLPI